jgi:preprotein translocase subunit YajC
MNLNLLMVILGDAAPPAGQPNSPGLLLFGYVAIFIVMFYFLAIRPQSKKAKEHSALLKTIKQNDKITTSAGIVGVVVTVREETLVIRSEDTKMEILKSAVAAVVPAKASSES